MSSPLEESKRLAQDLPRRFAFSFLFGTASVILGTAFFIVFDSSHPATAVRILSYIAAVPLLPGIGFVAMFFNSWQAVHQGQIALVPLVSVPVDVGVIFVAWTLLNRRKSPGSDKHVALHMS